MKHTAYSTSNSCNFLQDSITIKISLELQNASGITYFTIPQPVISDELYFLIMFISQGIICQAITVLGIFGNIINCIVFVKQGFSDNINVSLLGLTISDLCSLICIMWTCLFFSPVVRDTDLFSPDVHILSGTWPHIIFTRITGWITAFISLERCVCVIKPLKIKTMFTRKRHFNAMI
ncbi:unnamed protein product, partial [Candidula unifasciata]